MNDKIRILHLEDDETDAEIIVHELGKSDLKFNYLLVSNKPGFEKALHEFLPDVILSDHMLPSFSSVEALQMVQSIRGHIPFILVTGRVSEEFSVNMMKEGLDDYLLKDRLQRLPKAIANAIEKVRGEKERELYYKEIASQEKKFRALIENSEEAIVLTDKNLKILYRSPSAERITGHTLAESEDTGFVGTTHPEDRGILSALIQNAIEDSCKPCAAIFRVKHKDGHYIWIDLRLTNLLEDENVRALVANFRDITGRKLSDQLLQKSEANLRTIFDGTNVSYVFTDKDFNLVSFNRQAFVGYKKELNADLAEGRNVIEYLPEERRAEARERYERVLRGERINYEINFLQPDKTQNWYNVNILPVHGVNNSILGLIISSEDITARKNAEFERDKMTRDLIQRNKDLEQFAYIISHNLRSPVANITGLVNIFIDSPEMSKEDFTRCMEGLLLSVKKLDEVIVDLNYVLQVRREINEKKEIVRFSDIVGDIEMVMKSVIEKENINIETRFDEVNEFFTIKSYLNSIFFNLIANSIKYRRRGPTLIRINSRLTENKLILTFKDNGLGIDLNLHGNKIFGLYKKFHTHKEGKGMGLYMVKTQVEILGGHISVKSEVNSGTEFTLEFDFIR